MENIKLRGRTIGWEKKAILAVHDDVLQFQDGDWFNAVTGNGMHRYGTLVVTGSSVIARQSGDPTGTRKGGTYRKTYPPKR